MTPLWDALAAYRLTRLATADVLLVGPREAVVRWAYVRAGLDWRLPLEEPSAGAWSDLAMADDDPPKVATLVTCRWCAGFWIAAVVVVARRLFPRAWPPLAKALAYSATAALLARLEDE